MTTEEYILGSMLVDNAVIPTVQQEIESDAFVNQGHRFIYEGILEVFDASGKVDALILYEHLDKKGISNRIGGAAALYDLVAPIAETDNAAHYVSILKEKWIRRRIDIFGDKIKSLSKSEVELPDLFDGINSLILELQRDNNNKNTQDIQELLKQITERIANPDDMMGLTTSWIELDLMLQGLQPGNLITVAGRASMGKTSYVLQLIANVALIHKKRCILFSLEMTGEENALRMIASESRIPFQQIRSGNIDTSNQLLDAIGRLHFAPIHINDEAGIKISELRGEAKRITSLYEDVGLVVIDYLQLITPPAKPNREQEVAALVDGCLQLARELHIPVIICSQMNRKGADDGRKPSLDMLRESSTIEQHSHVVMFLHRPDYYDEECDEQGIVEVVIKKNRNGPTGSVRLEFDKELMRFNNIL